ncbi:maleylpyruvate isomerase family mycothiol-dependent enzyme [Desertimonas flava]|uniref:maleylpyruvate isomerase family mycothiol-dependent enzyme n=1 Tax=Desertimonas flava TaxID=2064846 RepID=UPI000E352E77|nr:maleylpyruvate isomerase family mycothiol-dependent enzyme [Desertimonas flava]
MERRHLLEAVSTESTALLDAARSAAPGAAVPGCPGWTVEDLVGHVAAVHHFWTYMVREGASTPEGYEAPTRPEPGSASLETLLDLAADRAAELLGVLRSADPDAFVWTWTGAQPSDWVVRRMAQETAVHRIDAEQAAGRTGRLDAALAADGVDEFLSAFLARQRAGAAPLTGTVHLHCTDADGEWTVAQHEDGEYSVVREHAKGDVALRGEAHDLLMVLWRRAGLDAVTVFGDAGLAADFVGASTPAAG